ncbi:MAG: dual specificity protein phosphatase family protein [bacterium]
MNEWMDFMEAHGIKAVCCLLDQEQLGFYQNSLISSYRKRFGSEKVCSAPITDYTFADETLLATKILPFLAASVGRGEKVVVHCSAGMGRTGHVLAAWLVYGRGLSNQAALEAVCSSGAQRNPCEVSGKNTLDALLDACRNYGVKVKKGTRQSSNQQFLYPEINSGK